MSFIVFDYHCDECGATERDKFVRSSEKDEQICSCGNTQRRMMPAPITTFKFGDRSAIKSKKAVSLRD